MVSHPSCRLDDAVHQRTRLGILAVLCEGGRADFSYLRDTLELTDGNLSRNLSKLQDAGYVRIDKVIEGRRSRTWLSATRAGRAALRAEIAALQEIIAGLGASPQTSAPAGAAEPAELSGRVRPSARLRPPPSPRRAPA